MKKVNENLDSITIADIENHKRISKEELLLDLNRLIWLCPFVVGRKFSCCKRFQKMCCWEVAPVTGT